MATTFESLYTIAEKRAGFQMKGIGMLNNEIDIGGEAVFIHASAQHYCVYR